MNVFLGSYGAKGQVNMDVDYIRAYNWPLEKEMNFLILALRTAEV